MALFCVLDLQVLEVAILNRLEMWVLWIVVEELLQLVYGLCRLLFLKNRGRLLLGCLCIAKATAQSFLNHIKSILSLNHWFRSGWLPCCAHLDRGKGVGILHIFLILLPLFITFCIISFSLFWDFPFRFRPWSIPTNLWAEYRWPLAFLKLEIWIWNQFSS